MNNFIFFMQALVLCNIIKYVVNKSEYNKQLLNEVE